MAELFTSILAVPASLFKSRAELGAENLVLRQQINVLRRRIPRRPALTNIDQLLFVWLYRWFPTTVGALTIVRPETIIRWHRVGFRTYWRWRSRNRVGRPKISAELRTLIRDMSRANPLWGSPRIHGELLKLGFDVAQSTVAKYIGTPPRPTIAGMEDLPSQPRSKHRCYRHVRRADGWLQAALWPCDHQAYRGHLVWINVTSNLTADWIARQITEAFPGIRRPGISSRPRRLVWPSRNATSCCHGDPGPTNGAAIALAKWPRRTANRFDTARVPRPCRGPGRSAPAPDPEHVCRLLQRTENPPIPDQDTPLHRVVERLGTVTSRPILGGLHHQYCRI